MTTRLLVACVLVLFSGVAFGASPNPSVEERMAILETKFDALSKQIEADRQSTLRLIEVTNEATNKRIEASNEATNDRIDALSKQIEALSKQVDANRQSILKLIEVTNEATNKRIEVSNEATNKRIDTLNNWGIALFAGVLAWIGVFITHALGFWGASKRDNAVATDANRLEARPAMQSADA